MAEIFISYTSSDRDWAFWIAKELETLGHAAYVHEWEIKGGDDIYAWMEASRGGRPCALCAVGRLSQGALLDAGPGVMRTERLVVRRECGFAERERLKRIALGQEQAGNVTAGAIRVRMFGAEQLFQDRQCALRVLPRSVEVVAPQEAQVEAEEGGGGAPSVSSSPPSAAPPSSR